MARILRRLTVAGFALTVWWLLVRVAVERAQISYDSGQDTVFVHSQTSRFWIRTRKFHLPVASAVFCPIRWSEQLRTCLRAGCFRRPHALHGPPAHPNY